MSKTAIVIGATGLVGSELVNCLVTTESVEKVVTITRRAVEHPSEKVRNHVVNFDRLDEYAELFKGELLFSCLGTTLSQAKTIDAQRRVDFSYQLQAAELAAGNGVEHYLLVSSSGANAKSLSAYLKMKGELEDEVGALAFKHISIFQPSLLLGNREDVRLAEGLGALLLPILCKLPGLGRYRPIRGYEVAQKMVAVSQQANAAFERFELDEVFP